MAKKFDLPEDGKAVISCKKHDWFYLACCDCGLVHNTEIINRPRRIYLEFSQNIELTKRVREERKIISNNPLMPAQIEMLDIYGNSVIVPFTNRTLEQIINMCSIKGTI